MIVGYFKRHLVDASITTNTRNFLAVVGVSPSVVLNCKLHLPSHLDHLER